MELPDLYKFQGWSIRYSLTTSRIISTSDPLQVKHVVFVHGTPWSSAVFRPIIDSLLAKQSYKILVYDLPGYGKSQKFDPGSRCTISQEDFAGDTSVKFQAGALAALLKHVELDGSKDHPTPAILAHDIAGAIVLRSHLLHECEYSSMMLVDTNAVLPWGDGFYKQVRSEPQPFVRLPSAIFEAVVRAVIRSACHNPNVLKTGWEDALAEPWIDSPSDDDGAKAQQRSFVRQIAQANDADVAEMLERGLYERVRCDVKIVWGEQDQWIPKEKMEDLVKRLGAAVKECVYIPDAGHLVMLDQPGRFAIEVFDWLNHFGSVGK